MTDAEKIIVGGLIVLCICIVISLMVSYVLGEVSDRLGGDDQ